MMLQVVYLKIDQFKRNQIQLEQNKNKNNKNK